MSRTLMLLLALGVVSFLTTSCAPAIRKPKKGWELEAKTSEFPTTQKNSDGSRVKVTMLATVENREGKRSENEKWHKLATEASPDENDALERLCEHPWWGKEKLKRIEQDEPWYFEKRIEDLQGRADTTFYWGKTHNYFFPLSEMKANWAYRKEKGTVPDDTTLDQFVKRWYSDGPYVEFTLKPKPERKPRDRLQVIRALLDSLDNAEKAEKK